MNHNIYLTLFMGLAVLLTGCTGLTPIDEIDSPSTTSPQGGASGDAPYGIVAFGHQAYSANESGFYYETRIQFKAPLNDSLEPKTFEDVVLCLYTSDGDVLNSTVVGDLQTPSDHATASIRSETIPTYVVIDHPDFRTYGKIYPDVLVWRNESQAHASERGPLEDLDPGFEYPRHTDPGRCM